MILFFRTPTKSVIATEVSQELPPEDIQKLSWLYGEATVENEENLTGCFIGPRREMITPWSTNAVEITQNMGLTGVLRIEEYFPVKDENAEYDPMPVSYTHLSGNATEAINVFPTKVNVSVAASLASVGPDKMCIRDRAKHPITVISSGPSPQFPMLVR